MKKEKTKKRIRKRRWVENEGKKKWKEKIKNKGGERDEEKGVYIDRVAGGNSDNSDTCSNVVASTQ